MRRLPALYVVALGVACGRLDFEPTTAEDIPWPTLEGHWTWMGGDTVNDQPGRYGTRGVPSTSNVPGARDNGASWTTGDALWLFGGLGFDETRTKGVLNDLWRFDPSTAEWTWVHGAKTAGMASVFGMLGDPDPANVPGARNDVTAWVGDDGALWLIGGGLRSPDGDLNDVWRYDLVAGVWTWIGGGTSANQPGVYGVQGVPSSANIPGGRSAAMPWAVGRDVWLFGGYGVDRLGGAGRLGDLWRYDVATNVWTWVMGADAVEQPAVHGIRGVAAAENTPGARVAGCTFVRDGELWLFGGTTIDQERNDLWRYTISAGTWTWIAGSSLAGQPGVYGARGVADPANAPGGRVSHACWTDPRGNFWLFGGRGVDSAGTVGSLADLWLYEPGTGAWTWVSGSDRAEQLGTYGTLAVPDAANRPGARMLGSAWAHADGSLWLLGGDFAFGATGTGTGALNDLWRYAKPSPMARRARSVHAAAAVITATAIAPR